VILYLLLAKKISDRHSNTVFLSRFSKFKSVIDAIDEYYHHAFAPEIIYAMNFVEESKISAELMSKHAKVGGSESSSTTFDERRFQTNLLYISAQI
jgi:hypothetical protein